MSVACRNPLQRLQATFLNFPTPKQKCNAVKTLWELGVMDRSAIALLEYKADYYPPPANPTESRKLETTLCVLCFMPDLFM